MQKIFILSAIAIIALLAFKLSDNINVKGKVTDNSGAPLAQVTVMIKGDKRGVQTDANGSYSINVPNEKSILVFTYVGYEKQEIKVGNKKTINVTLSPFSQKLDEVVVVGYSTVKKRELTGAVASVQSYQLNGAVSGVMISGNKAVSYDSDKSFAKEDFNREGYDYIKENSFLKVKDNPLSTFSIDVDAASYSNVRRYINNGQLPPPGAVRIEEMVNYFKYDYPQPQNNDPFSVNTEITECPWSKGHRLALIGLQGKIIPVENLPPSNIVFLIDVSGSMMEPDKLPLVQRSMKLLADQLREQDNVAIIAYAGNAGLVLPSTNGSNKTKIKEAVDALEAGGSTAGGEGIKLAYKTAIENFKKNGNNRVILCTDGDFNVGVSSDDELERLIEKERETGVFLTVLGFGTGNYQDAKMQKLADKGNGNHAYIDQLSEAKKVLVNEFGGTLFTIAKDVKLQIEFNPALVQGYRLIGYENRLLANEDFNDDKKDAGELGSGHTVTALYEIIPVGVQSGFLKKTDTLKYQAQQGFERSSFNNELMTIKLRYKKPDGDVSRLIEHPVTDKNIPLAKTSDNLRFAAAVAEFGLLLRNSAYKQEAQYESVIRLANNAIGNDKEGYRKEFVKLVEGTSDIADGSNPKEGDVSSNK